MLAKIGRAALIVALATSAAACKHTSTKAPSTLTTDASPVTIGGALGNTLVKAGESGRLTARIVVKAADRRSEGRPPVNLALLVDTSGSMEGRAIEDARAASLSLLGTLSPSDRLAVVVFDSKAEVLLPSTKIDDANVSELRAKIGKMKARGTTDMARGLRLALDEVERNVAQDGVNRVVLLGDGVPNAESAIPSLVAEASQRGISITTMGLGDDYDETLMGEIAQSTGGAFRYVDDSAKVASFFKEEVVRLHGVVARHASLELHPGPGVTVEEVIGRRTTPGADRSVLVGLGDLAYGEEQEVIVSLAASGAKDGAAIEALDAIVRFQDGSGRTQHEESFYLGARATSDVARIEASENQDVADAAARAQDAAATLARIEEARRAERSKAQSAPSAAGAPPMRSAPKKRAEEIRRSHDLAIQNFLAH